MCRNGIKYRPHEKRLTSATLATPATTCALCLYLYVLYLLSCARTLHTIQNTRNTSNCNASRGLTTRTTQHKRHKRVTWSRHDQRARGGRRRGGEVVWEVAVGGPSHEEMVKMGWCVCELERTVARALPIFFIHSSSLTSRLFSSYPQVVYNYADCIQ